MQQLKLCVFETTTGTRLGSVADGRVYDLNLCCARYQKDQQKVSGAYGLAATLVPGDLGGFIRGGAAAICNARESLQWVMKAGVEDGPLGEPLWHDTRSTKLRAPILSSTKVICMGGVYPSHLQIAGVKPHEFPIPFYKLTQSVVGPDDWVIIPKHHQEPVVGGSELTVVFGRKGRSITVEQANDFIWGYTVLNDLTLRGRPGPTHKVFETSSPVGPWIVPKDQIADPHNLRLLFRINGAQVQDGNTSSMLATIQAMIAEVSKWMTLEPGDILATGDLGGTQFLRPGDVVEAEVEGVGVLLNPIKLEE